MRNDFHQSNACSVKIDIRTGGILIVEAFASILLDMNALNANGFFDLIFQLNVKNTFLDEGKAILGNLIACWIVGVKVVFAIHDGCRFNSAINGEAQTDGLIHALTIQCGQHTGHGDIKIGYTCVGLLSENLGRSG